ncbi:MAG: hypothetical protein AAF467_25125 [Actinomycetota bacterium]
MAENWSATYYSAPDRVRRLFSQAFLKKVIVDEDGLEPVLSEAYLRLKDLAAGSTLAEAVEAEQRERSIA